MSATIAVVLYPRANKDGQYPLALRVTKDRKSSYNFLQHSIEKKHWDKNKRRVKKGHPNSARLNALISKKLSEAEMIYLDAEREGKEGSSAHAIKDQVSSKKITKTFFDMANSYLSNLEKEKKFNRLSADQPRVKRFRKFLGDADLHFKEITPSLLKEFKAYLIGAHGVSERTAMNYLVVIRTIFNMGINDGHTDSKYYPFGRNKVRIRFPDSMKIGLTKDEIQLLRNMNLSDKPKWDNARNIWLTSYALAGARISDVLRLRWSDIKNGRIYYQMGKNLKTDSIKLPELALEILEIYKSYDPEQAPEYIFNELNALTNRDDQYEIHRRIKNAVKSINGYLGKIADEIGLDKKLTCHVARHSFGLAGKDTPLPILQRLFRHGSINVTANYMKSISTDDVDDALDAVLK